MSTIISGQRIAAVVLVLSILCLPGCLGTIGTRTGLLGAGHAREGTWAGAYPYEALYNDGGSIVVGIGEYQDWGLAFSLMGLVSIPFDLIVDTALLPVDLIAWPLGWSKYHAP